MIYHMIAFLLGFIMDLILGDPYWLPHPIRFIGNLISVLERRLNGRKNPLNDGKLLVFIVLLSTGIISGVILVGAYFIHQYLGCLIEIIMTYQILACRCLKVESMKVYYALKNGTLQEAQKAVSMIVGRDTLVLDKIGVTKATVETVAENTSDGVIAPMIYLAIGGPILGFLYKAVNTMDSMVGYKNERYLYFGRAAAKLDDRMNFLPSRISAYLMILASFLLGKVYDGKRAYFIFNRDRFNHASPNSAQTEAVSAGALGIQLAGNASYFGKLVEKPYIGDRLREIEYADIIKVNRLLYAAAMLCEGICLIIMMITVI